MGFISQPEAAILSLKKAKKKLSPRGHSFSTALKQHIKNLPDDIIND